jgi:hypothetical protein
LIGVDEKAQRLTNVDPIELADWSKRVERFFDGYAPRLVRDANVRSGSDTIVALYFETHQGAPFVVQYTKGSYPEFVVPWREGTGKRAARRDDLLRILVPIRRFSALIDELNYNLDLVQATPTNESLGTLFREEEFDRVIADGALSTLTNDERQLVISAYLGMNRANQLVTGAISSLALPNTMGRPLDRAWNAVKDCQKRIEGALAGLSRFLK